LLSALDITQTVVPKYILLHYKNVCRDHEDVSNATTVRRMKSNINTVIGNALSLASGKKCTRFLYGFLSWKTAGFSAFFIIVAQRCYPGSSPNFCSRHNGIGVAHQPFCMCEVLQPSCSVTTAVDRCDGDPPRKGIDPPRSTSHTCSTLLPKCPVVSFSPSTR
jgi:hypothetical protein